MLLFAVQSLIRTLEQSLTPAAAAAALIDALTGAPAAVGLLRPGYGNLDVTTSDPPPDTPVLGWLAAPDAAWQGWHDPHLIDGAAWHELEIDCPPAWVLPIGGHTRYGVLVIIDQDNVLTEEASAAPTDAVLAAALLAARLERLEAEKHWQSTLQQAHTDEPAAMTALNEIGRALVTSRIGEAVWEALAEQITLLFDASSFFCALYDADSGLVSFPLASEEGMQVHYPPTPATGLCRAVIAHGVEMYFQHLEEEAERLAALDVQMTTDEPGAYAQSWLGVPIRGRDHAVAGVLAVQNVLPASFDDADLSTLTHIAQLIALALDNQQVAALETERRTLATALMEMGQLVSSSTDYDEALDHLLAQIQRIAPYDSANILLASEVPENGPQTLLLYTFNSTELFLKGAKIAFAPSHPIAQAMTAGQPILLTDAQSHPGWQPRSGLPDADALAALLIMPMLVYNRVAGVITLGRFSPVPFTEAQTSGALALTRQSAMALETARLRAQYQSSYQVQVERARRLASIHQMTGVISSSLKQSEVLDAAARLLTDLYEVDHCGIVMFDDDEAISGTLVSEYPPTGTVGLRISAPRHDAEGLLAGNIVLFDNDEMHTELRTVGSHRAMVAPMFARDKLIGSIGLDMKSGGRSFSEEDRQTYLTLAGQIAMAINNAALYEKAVEANRLKSEFLTTISHELRTPLNAIIGYSDMLLQDFYGTLNPRQRDRVDRVYASGQHLLELINDVLDLSKIEAGQITLNMSTGYASETVRSVINDFVPRAHTKGLALTADFTADEPNILYDATYLRRALANLIDNALKFTEQGSVQIVVRGHTQPQNDALLPAGHYIAIDVQDTGIGIRPEDLSIIFETFRQVDGSAVRQYGGTGLGLALTRQIVRLHAGAITVASTPGAGSTFTVLLPIAHLLPDGSTMPTIVEDDRLLILLIEDDPAQQQLLHDYLRDQPIQLVVTSQPQHGLTIARLAQPDLIITDLMMPEMNGWDVLRALKGDPATTHIPVIILSIIDQRLMGMSMGASDYLLKPVNRSALVQLLAKYPPRRPRRMV